MNERIKELALLSGFDIDTNVSFAEKTRLDCFAWLIIRECAHNLEIHSTCFDGDVGRGIKTAARLTKEHFGVE